MRLRLFARKRWNDTNYHSFIRRHDTVIVQEWFTVGDAAEYLRVSRRTLHKLTIEGRLPASRVGQERHWFLYQPVEN